MGCSPSAPVPGATTEHVVSPVAPHFLRGSARFGPSTSGHAEVLVNDGTPCTVIDVGNAIKFLLDKRVYARDEELRRSQLTRIRFPDTAPALERLQYEHAQRNLLRLYALVVKGEVRAAQPPLDCKLDMGTWGNLYEFPEPFRGRTDFIVQRLQNGNSCIHNARTIVLQYAIFRTEILAAQAYETEIVMIPHLIDLAAYWRDASPEALEALVFHTRGVPVRALLLSTLAKGSTLASSEEPHKWVQLLDLYGPALITEFRVFPGFLDDAEKHHAGLPIGTCLNDDRLPRLCVIVVSGPPPHSASTFPPSPIFYRHSMILLAARSDAGTGRLWFLVQNTASKKKKQFFEADEVYLEGCSAFAIFIKTPQSVVRAGTAVSDGFFWVESDCGDSIHVHPQHGAASSP